MSLLNEVSNQTNSAVPEFRNKIQAIEKDLEKLAHTSGEKIDKTMSQISHSIRKSLNRSKNYIKENPGRSLVFATILGMAAGSFLTLLLTRSKK